MWIEMWKSKYGDPPLESNVGNMERKLKLNMEINVERREEQYEMRRASSFWYFLCYVTFLRVIQKSLESISIHFEYCGPVNLVSSISLHSHVSFHLLPFTFLHLLYHLYSFTYYPPLASLSFALFFSLYHSLPSALLGESHARICAP